MINDYILKCIIMQVLSFCGFFIAFYIYRKKSKKQKLICPRQGECDKVVNSSSSYFLGLSIEILGLFYYLFVFLGYMLILNLYFLNYNFLLLEKVITISTVFAFLFSLRLVYLQHFVLKMYCFWCLLSSAVSFLIFLASLNFLYK